MQETSNHFKYAVRDDKHEFQRKGLPRLGSLKGLNYTNPYIHFGWYLSGRCPSTLLSLLFRQDALGNLLLTGCKLSGIGWVDICYYCWIGIRFCLFYSTH